MSARVRFSEYFGFTVAEIDMLYQRYLNDNRNPKVTREGLKTWYDGYFTMSGERMYNPRSVVNAYHLSCKLRQIPIKFIHLIIE